MSSDSSISSLPESVHEVLRQSMSERNLKAQPVVEARSHEMLRSAKLPGQRIQWMAENHKDSDLVLLIETRAEFFSQMTGRYRWVVTAHLVLSDPSDLSRSIEKQLEIPVFMQFHHERDEAVLEAAAPSIERALASMIDSWLSAP